MLAKVVLEWKSRVGMIGGAGDMFNVVQCSIK